jgi:hypothetical protein
VKARKFLNSYTYFFVWLLIFSYGVGNASDKKLLEKEPIITAEPKRVL